MHVAVRCCGKEWGGGKDGMIAEQLIKWDQWVRNGVDGESQGQVKMRAVV